MTLKISSQDDLPLGQFRPITLIITCDCGGMFCQRFEMTGDREHSYVELQHAATALGWLNRNNQWFGPGCH